MDWYALGRSIGVTEGGLRQVAIHTSENAALFDQWGVVQRELETLQRMATQHAIDSGIAEGRSTRAALQNGRENA